MKKLEKSGFMRSINTFFPEKCVNVKKNVDD